MAYERPGWVIVRTNPNGTTERVYWTDGGADIAEQRAARMRRANPDSIYTVLPAERGGLLDTEA